MRREEWDLQQTRASEGATSSSRRSVLSKVVFSMFGSRSGAADAGEYKYSEPLMSSPVTAAGDGDDDDDDDDSYGPSESISITKDSSS